MVMQKLNAAKQIILEAIKGLDESHDECASCHFQIKKHMDQYNAAKRLRHAIHDIERAQGNLLTEKKPYGRQPLTQRV